MLNLVTDNYISSGKNLGLQMIIPQIVLAIIKLPVCSPSTEQLPTKDVPFSELIGSGLSTPDSQ